MNKYSAKTISSIILFTLGGLNLLVISLFSFHVLEDNTEARFHDRSEILLTETVDRINVNLLSAESVMTYTAELLGSSEAAPGLIVENLLKDMARLIPDAALLIFSDNQNNYNITIKDELPESYNPVERPWYIIAAKLKSDPVWSQPFFSYLDQSIVFSVSVPVISGGESNGVVGAVFKADDIGAGLRYKELGSDGFMMLLSENGRVLANRNNYFIGSQIIPDDILLRTTDSAIFDYKQNINDKPYNISISRIPLNGMYIVSAVSWKEIRKSLMDRFIPVLIIEIIILLGFTTIIYLLAWKALKPVENLTDLMVKAQQGDYSVRAEFNEYHEIKVLSGQFNEMFDAIRTRDEILKNREIEIKNLAYYDTLTGLPNREYLQKKLSEAVKEGSACGALLFIDLDGFKIINDTMGHSVGDLVLKEVATRLMHNLRYRQFASRIGGDEFIVLLQDIQSMEIIIKVSRRILEILNSPILIKHTRYEIGASIGVVLYPLHGSNSEILLRKADMAMYKAKRSGKNNFQVFEENLEEEIIRRNKLEKGIRAALKEELFFLHYQPQFSLNTKDIIGFEALLRNNCHDLAGFSTQEIITAAEETGLIIEIERLVFYQAFTFIREVNSSSAKDYFMSVNVSSQHLMQSDFVEMLLSAISDVKIPRGWIELEITESVIMESLNSGKQRIQFLKDEGFKIAMDDFGTGYSSLNYLQNLPISSVKIDRTFLNLIESDQKTKKIVELIIKIAQTFELCVTAEGIETEEQYRILKNAGCNRGQGYLVSKAQSGSELKKQLQIR